MSVIRVTQRLIIERSLHNFSTQQRRLLALQEQLATGLRVNRMSDDPMAARLGLNAKLELAASEQYLSNISTANLSLQTTESVLLTVSDAVQRVDELLLQGSSGTLGQEQRDQIAMEVDQLLESLLIETNRQHDGRYAFAGTATGDAPFVATRNANGEITAVTYVGNDERYEVEVSKGSTVPVNVTGADAFTSAAPGGVDLFDELIQARDALRAGNVNGINDGRNAMTAARNQILLQISQVGALNNRLERIAESLETIQVQQQGILSENIDADIAEVIVELNAQTNVYQASLDAASRVVQPSLLDYLR